jgi:hypothetical protein
VQCAQKPLQRRRRSGLMSTRLPCSLLADTVPSATTTLLVGVSKRFTQAVCATVAAAGLDRTPPPLAVVFDATVLFGVSSPWHLYLAVQRSRTHALPSTGNKFSPTPPDPSRRWTTITAGLANPKHTSESCSNKQAGHVDIYHTRGGNNREQARTRTTQRPVVQA